MKTSGFTLVELLVTTTIIAIISAVGFMSYSRYSQSARDSMRLEDLTVIMGRLKEQKSKLGAYPMPETYATINDGTNDLAYQGKAGDSLRKNVLSIPKGAIDPKNQINYTYTRDRRGTKAQLLGYFETNGYDGNFALLVPQAAAASLANRTGLYPIANGDHMGIVVLSSDFSPIEETLSGTVTTATLKSAVYSTVTSCIQT